MVRNNPKMRILHTIVRDDQVTISKQFTTQSKRYQSREPRFSSREYLSHSKIATNVIKLSVSWFIKEKDIFTGEV